MVERLFEKNFESLETVQFTLQIFYEGAASLWSKFGRERGHAFKLRASAHSARRKQLANVLLTAFPDLQMSLKSFNNINFIYNIKLEYFDVK